MPDTITLILTLGQIQHQATLDLPENFTTPDIFDQEQDALALLAILQYTSRNTLLQLDKELKMETTSTKKAAE